MIARSRGMTLIETLAALGLLSMLAGGLFGLATSMTQDLPDRDDAARWAAAARAVERYVHEEWILPARPGAVSIAGDGDSLVIRRATSSVSMELRGSSLVAVYATRERRLIGDVAMWSFTRDEQEPRLLRFKVTSLKGQTHAFEVRVP